MLLLAVPGSGSHEAGDGLLSNGSTPAHPSGELRVAPSSPQDHYDAASLIRRAGLDWVVGGAQCSAITPKGLSGVVPEMSGVRDTPSP